MQLCIIGMQLQYEMQCNALKGNCNKQCAIFYAVCNAFSWNNNCSKNVCSIQHMLKEISLSLSIKTLGLMQLCCSCYLPLSLLISLPCIFLALSLSPLPLFLSGGFWLPSYFNMFFFFMEGFLKQMPEKSDSLSLSSSWHCGSLKSKKKQDQWPIAPTLLSVSLFPRLC